MLGFCSRAARTVITEAQAESRELRHNYLGVEHILLGLLREPDSAAAQTLRSLGVSMERVRERLLEIVGEGEDALPAQVQLPFTPRAKSVGGVDPRADRSASGRRVRYRRGRRPRGDQAAGPAGAA
jgi:ATP-dependent Clp protease ATP-binding subunit ClpA